MNEFETRSLFDALPIAARLYSVLDDVKSGEYDDVMVPGEPLKIDVMGAFVAKSKNMRDLMAEIEDAITQRKVQLEPKQSGSAAEVNPAGSKDVKCIEDLLRQNVVSRKELRTAFGIDQNDRIDTRELDGMLKDCVDENENSQELVRSVRDKTVTLANRGVTKIK